MGKMNNYPLEIHFTDKALRFIQVRKMKDPKILVYLKNKPISGGCCGGGMNALIPTAEVRMIENGKLGEGFVKLPSRGGPQIYFAKSLYDIALKTPDPLIIDVTGFFRRTLKIEGLNLNYLKGKDSRERASCHLEEI